jgi:hypothetical protein
MALAWLQALAARGVCCSIRNGRLRMYPEIAYKDLSDDEHAVLRHHRDEIKAIVAAGYPTPETTSHPEVPVVHAETPTPEPEPAPEPEPPLCAYCHRVPCYGQAHWAYAALHWNDPVEVQQRDARATAEMLESLRRARRGER